MRIGLDATRNGRRAQVRLGNGLRIDKFCSRAGAPTNEGTALNMATGRAERSSSGIGPVKEVGEQLDAMLRAFLVLMEEGGDAQKISGR